MRTILLAALLVATLPVATRASILQPANSWNRHGGSAGARFGEAVVPAGDVDGDGYGDLLVGAPGRSNGAGAAYLFKGGAGGPGDTPAWSFLGPQAAAATGAAVAPAGDINGDGYGDVLVGSPLYNGAGGQDHGRVDVFLGSANGLASAPSQTFVLAAVGGQFGASLGPAGDVNADGYDDIVIGAPFTQNTLPAEGAAYVYEGGPAGLSGPTWNKFGGQGAALLGYAVSGAGDVDADGYGDVILGAPGKSVGFARDGAAYVYRGSALGLLNTASESLNGPADSSAFGAAVSLAGDANADGYADVLIGAPNLFANGIAAGRAWLLAGTASGNVGTILWQGLGTTDREFYGSRVACAGDLNGDGYPDFAIGADRWPSPGERRGRVEVWLGGPHNPVLDASFSGTVNGQALGAGLGTGGDLDGDGFSDLAVGEPGVTIDFAGEGRVSLLRGSASKPVLASGWPVIDAEAGAQFGLTVAGGMDTFGSLQTHVLAGAPFADPGLADAGRIGMSLTTHPYATWWSSSVLVGDRVNGKLGTRLARAGDVNGDGADDLLVGSHLATNGEGGEGRAQLYLGSGNGPVAPAAWDHEPNLVSAREGASVGGGDFDGDGFADLAVGQVGGVAGGNVKIYPGGPGGPPTVPTWTTPPVGPDTGVGWVLATGDWDADGFSDLAVGAYIENHGQTNEGRVYVYFGGPNGLDATASWMFEIDVPGAQFGYALDDAGDVNGDGVSDLVVGAPTANPGRVLVFFGNRARAVPRRDLARTFFSDDGGPFGWAVTGIGDVDKDGYGDILVGAFQYSNGESGEGKVWLFRGSEAGGVLTPWWSAESNVPGASFGFTVARAGDTNRDGWPDFAVGAPFYPPGGAVYLYQGGGRGTYKVIAQSRVGGALAMGGRLDPASQLFLHHTSRSPAGREKSRAELHVATQYESFGGGAHTVFGPFDHGAPAAGTFGSSITYAHYYAAVTPGVGYRFRTRNLPHSPYFAPSPWSQPRGFERGDLHFRVGGSIVGAPGAGESVGGGLSLRTIDPSPFRDRTRIAYVLSTSGQVALDVFDARGRLVRRLASGRAEAGEHAAVFDGMSVAAGVYFVSLRMDGEARQVRKIVRLP